MATYPGTLTHPTQGAQTFLTANFPGGWLLDVAMVEEEEIKSPGVSGQRWRTTDTCHQDVVLTTLFDCSSYAAAIATGQTYMKCHDGQPVTLTVTLAGTTYRWQNVHIVGVSPVAQPGTVAGGSTSSLASLSCEWGLRLIDPATTGSVG